MDKGNDSRIYVQRTFDVTELEVLQNQSEGAKQGGPMGIENTRTETATAWIEGSRGSSQEVLVRDPALETEVIR